jgi:hypothetical protein
VVVKDLDEVMKHYSDVLGVGPFLIYSMDPRELERTGRFTYLETQERLGTTFELWIFPRNSWQRSDK